MLCHCAQVLSLLVWLVAAKPGPGGPGSSSTFSPDLSNFDAYGVKVAANDVMTVLVQPESQMVVVQFAPYDYSVPALTCPFGVPNLYIYSVAVGRYQTTKQFVFSGEDTAGNVYIGLAVYQSSTPCKFNWYSHKVSATHQEFYAIGVDPTGSIAYGSFQGAFFTYQLTTPYAYNNMSSSVTDVGFMPRAMDVQGSSVIVAGYTNASLIVPQQFRPVVYLLDQFGNRKSFWQYTAVRGSWQADSTNIGADSYAARFDMSVEISDTGGVVLVGIPSINTVFILLINQINNPTSLSTVNNFTNGNTAVGFGKAVAFLDSAGTLAAVLSNVYTVLNYEWVSSQVQIYSDVTASPSLISGWPNSQQTLGATTFNPSLLQIVSTPTLLTVLDILGNVYLILPSAPGLYSQTHVGGGRNPSFSTPAACLGGMYKNETNILPCDLCPLGTKNPGGYGVSCVACNASSFCPLGSVQDVPQAELDVVSQATSYPLSPESVIFDEVLVQNMFSIGSTIHCLIVSPLFWALISAAFAIFVFILMTVLSFVPRTHRFLRAMKLAFQRADLVREGELWTGGLASLAIIILVSSAIHFSVLYYQQYPIETAGDSTFACDTSLRNAQFSTTVQLLSTPPNDEEQTIFEMMDTQTFVLTIRFVNTLFTCASVTILNMRPTIPTTILPTNCTSASNGSAILILSVALASLNNNLKIILNGVLPIGAVSIGMSAPSSENETSLLRALNFSQPYYRNGRTLAPDSPITMQLTKVINITEPIDDAQQTYYAALFIPTFLVNMDQMLVTVADYAVQTITQTTVSLVTSETPYFIVNRQKPIAKASEIIFHNILFLIVCLEMFGLLFLLVKLFLLPLIQFVGKRLKCKVTDKLEHESAEEKRAPVEARRHTKVFPGATNRLH